VSLINASSVWSQRWKRISQKGSVSASLLVKADYWSRALFLEPRLASCRNYSVCSWNRLNSRCWACTLLNNPNWLWIWVFYAGTSTRMACRFYLARCSAELDKNEFDSVLVGHSSTQKNELESCNAVHLGVRSDGANWYILFFNALDPSTIGWTKRICNWVWIGWAFQCMQESIKAEFRKRFKGRMGRSVHWLGISMCMMIKHSNGEWRKQYEVKVASTSSDWAFQC